MIKACKVYDQKAQRELYLLLADDMMSVAIRYAKDLPEAKDVVHDAFIKIFKAIPKFVEGKGSFEGWVRRIVVNVAISKFRKQKKMTPVAGYDFSLSASEDFSIVDTLAAEDILMLIQQLPERCRMIFNLYVIEGFSHLEIGELLKITSSTSRSQLTRAKKLLRRQIEHQRTCFKAC